MIQIDIDMPKHCPLKNITDTNVGDTIYRQDVIDAIDKYISGLDAIDANFLDGLKTAKKLIKEELLSAQPTQNNTSNALKSLDCIDKQAAIDALEKEKPTPFVNEDGSIDPFGAGRQNQWYRDGIAIMNLSSAQSEQRWIPVTERLPRDDEDVIVTCLDDSGDTPYSYTTVAWHYKGMWVCDNMRCPFVIAWMPLPKPYAERKEDE